MTGPPRGGAAATHTTAEQRTATRVTAAVRSLPQGGGDWFSGRGIRVTKVVAFLSSLGFRKCEFSDLVANPDFFR